MMQMPAIVAGLVLRWNTVFEFCDSKSVISIDKNFDNSLQCLKFATKTATAPRQNRDKCPQVG
jgi:hypothetical protein